MWIGTLDFNGSVSMVTPADVAGLFLVLDPRLLMSIPRILPRSINSSSVVSLVVTDPSVRILNNDEIHAADAGNDTDDN